ncbi:MAG: DUF5668 domain-containing protein [Dehalococcoidales bacterium]
MQNNDLNNASAAENPGAQGPSYRDWREERREWRRAWKEERRRLPCHGLFWGLGLLLLGVLLLLNQAGWVSGDTWWQSLLIGLGAISVVNGVAHYRSPAYRWGSYGKFVFGAILILVGVLLMLGISQWWPAVLIVAGIALLGRFFWR